MVSRSLLSLPHAFFDCIRKTHTSSFDQSSIGEYTRQLVRLALGLKRSRTRCVSRRSIDRARAWLSAFRVPSTKMASPLSATTSVMNALEGLIFNRSVHHLNLGRGAG